MGRPVPLGATKELTPGAQAHTTALGLDGLHLARGTGTESSATHRNVGAVTPRWYHQAFARSAQAGAFGMDRAWAPGVSSFIAPTRILYLSTAN